MALLFITLFPECYEEANDGAVDVNGKAQVKPDGTGFDVANVKVLMNAFDQIASGRGDRSDRRVGRCDAIAGNAAYGVGNRRGSRDPARVERRTAVLWPSPRY